MVLAGYLPSDEVTKNFIQKYSRLYEFQLGLVKWTIYHFLPTDFYRSHPLQTIER